MAKSLEHVFAKGSLGYYEYCDWIDEQFKYGASPDDFSSMRKLAFLMYDLNCDELISDIDIVAFDSYFIKGKQDSNS